MKNVLLGMGVGVAAVAGFVALVALFLAISFGIGWLIGALIVWMIPALGMWATTTLGVSFPVMFGAFFVAIRLLFGKSSTQ
jgi:hypothetical protein